MDIISVISYLFALVIVLGGVCMFVGVIAGIGYLLGRLGFAASSRRHYPPLPKTPKQR